MVRFGHCGAGVASNIGNYFQIDVQLHRHHDLHPQHHPFTIIIIIVIFSVFVCIVVDSRL